MVIELAPLTAILRADQIVTSDTTNYYLPDNLVVPIVFPESLAEVSAIVKLAAQQQWSLVVVGSGSKLHLGNPLRRVNLLLATTRLPLVIEHTAADLTARVSAGSALSFCQAQFALAGQFLPVVPMQAGKTTMGGLVATNSPNQWRLAYGSIRDWLIGITVINSQGEMVKAGGQVVKNVAGYDLMKLYTGSLGTLGVIVEMNVKLRPKPAAELTWQASYANFSQAWQAAQACLMSQIAPVAVDLLNITAIRQLTPSLSSQTLSANAINGGTVKHTVADASQLWLSNLSNIDSAQGDFNGYCLLIRYAGRMTTIQSQLTQTQQLTNTIGTIISQADSEAWWSSLTTFGETADLHLRASLRPQYLPQLWAYLEAKLPEAIAIWAQLGTGVVQIAVPINQQPSAQEMPSNMKNRAVKPSNILELRFYLESMGGSLVVERAPSTWRSQLDVWGTAPAQFLMQQIKQALDPQNIFSPGRFVGGI